MVFERCFICKSEKNDPVKYGKILENDEMAVHYYCLLLTSNLVQNGKTDNEGFLGFLPTDIEKEVKRIKGLPCYICQGKQANIGCCAKKCRKAFHTVCGIDNGCLSEFRDTFRSFCDQHVVINDRSRHTSDELCIICSDEMGKFDKTESIRPPCCRNGWFHKYCLSQYALTSCSLTKCLLCNNTHRFKQIELRGIFIPEQDAAWEQEANAFVELLIRPNSCSAIECQCPEGRDVDSDDWDFKICDTCGSVGMHIQCMEDKTVKRFTCESCSVIAAKYPPLPDEPIEENRPSSRNSNSSTSSFGRRRIRRMSLFSSANPRRPPNRIYSSSSSISTTASSSSSSSSRNSRQFDLRMSTGSESSDLVINPANFVQKRQQFLSESSTTDIEIHSNNKRRPSLNTDSDSSDIIVNRKGRKTAQVLSISSSTASTPRSVKKKRRWRKGRKRNNVFLDKIPELQGKNTPVVLLQKMNLTMIEWYTSGDAFKISQQCTSKELVELENCNNFPLIVPKIEEFSKEKAIVTTLIEKEGFEIKAEIDTDDIQIKAEIVKDDFEINVEIEKEDLEEKFSTMGKTEFHKFEEEYSLSTDIKYENLKPEDESSKTSESSSSKNGFNLLKSLKEEYDNKPFPFLVPKIESSSPSERASMILLRYESAKSLKRKILSDCREASPNFKKPRIEFKVEPKKENEENSSSGSGGYRSQLQSTLYNYMKMSPGKENPTFLSPRDEKKSHIRSIIKKKPSPIANGQKSLLSYFSKM